MKHSAWHAILIHKIMLEHITFNTVAPNFSKLERVKKWPENWVTDEDSLRISLSV